MSTEQNNDLELVNLEELFNEPHCDSPHRSPKNRECFHKVVATVIFPCGCRIEACVGQVSYSTRMKNNPKSGVTFHCNLCSTTRLNPKQILIFPKG
jgi:hypothetical protein